MAGDAADKAAARDRSERTKGRFMQKTHIQMLAATAVAFGLSFGAGAFAQEAPAEPPADAAEPAAPAEATEFSQEQLDAFVAAALDVSAIQQDAAATLMTTEDQAGQDEVLEQANQQMIEAIESEPGITVPEYIAIAEAAETDPDLRSQLEEMIVAAQSDEGGAPAQTQQ